MRKLFRILASRAFISLLGLLCIGLLIWFVGPLVAIAEYEPLAPPWHRWAAIALLVVFWFFGRLRATFQANRANRKMLDEMIKAKEAEAAAETDPIETASIDEIGILRQRMEEALETLKKGRFSGPDDGRHRLYQLPWYILIGPPGSGKTTALVNSGLQFPLAERFGPSALRGVGGTQHCDWWFTDQAVLLDTAGRYTTQDSHQATDSSAWNGFLDLLKKYRGRRPINGALVTISVTELMELGETERTHHASAIRQRIEELQEHLNIRFPVYFLFTKADLIAGFCDFFDDLDARERNQVWGMTFDTATLGDPGQALEAFALEHAKLIERLNERLVVRLQQERDPDKRARLYLFPQQLASLREVTRIFLSDIFATTRFEATAMLRGVYYTSGTQEGHPIDRLMGVMANALSLRRGAQGAPGSGRSYFVKGLLQDVVFEEAELAGTNPKKERHRSWLQRIAYAALVASVVIGGGAWFTSYTRNSAYIRDVAAAAVSADQAIAGLSEQQRDPVDALAALSQIAAIPGGVDDANADVPWTSRLGLYQGRRLGRAASAAYERALNNQLLPRLMLRLEDALRAPEDVQDERWDYLYETLKVYLMLGPEVQRFDLDTARAWLALDWEQYPLERLSDSGRLALFEHLDTLLEGFNDRPIEFGIDSALVARVRDTLRRVPAAERVYSRIKREQRIDGKPPALELTRAVPEIERAFVHKSGQALDQEISGLYTAAGFRDVFLEVAPAVAKQLDDEAWVLNASEDPAQAPVSIAELTKSVSALYMQDYVAIWQGLLDNLEIVSPRSVKQTIELLGLLSGPSSPMRALLEAVAEQTAFRSGEAVSEVADQVAERGLLRAKRRLERLIGTSVRTPTPKLPELEHPAQPVRAHFAKLNDHVLGAAGSSPPIERTLALVDELYAFVHALANERADGVMLEASKSQATGIVAKLQQEATRQPDPLNRWLVKLALGTSRLINSGVQRDLNAGWRSAGGLELCEKAIAGRYPLSKSSPSDVTLQDFARFFGPGGVMASYFDTHLKPFVDTSRDPWRVRASQNPAPAIARGTITQFQRADAIRRAFFSADAQALSIQFTLKPLTMDPSIGQFVLDVGDHTLTYRHDPVRETTLQWPGSGEHRARFEMLPPTGDTRSVVKEQGDWAWFRMLQRFEPAPGPTPETFTVTFAAGTRQATYELRASSALNAFRLPELELFQCPQTF